MISEAALPKDPHQQLRVQRFLLSLAMYVLTCVPQGVSLYNGISPAWVMGTWLVIAVLTNLGFFLLFWPTSAPLVLRPVVGAIEFLSFLLRPVTLALRLFGNMLGGHVAMKVFAGFVVSLGAMAAGGGLGLLGIPGAALSLGGVVALTALEFLVAFLQAFVFAVLTCVYLNDVVNLGDHLRHVVDELCLFDSH